jgi:nitrogen fixation NifU-like protein
MVDSESLYQEVILDHFRRPRHQRELAPGELQVEGNNPVCGDRLSLTARLEGGHLAGIAWRARGCALSVASASLLAEACQGLPLAEARDLAARVEASLAAEPAPATSLPGDLAALTSVRRFPMRHKCALLPWRALLNLLDRLEAK